MIYMTLHITGFEQNQMIFCTDPHKIAAVKHNYFVPRHQNAAEFVRYLEKTNRICSLQFALFIPVRASSLRDILFPYTAHYGLRFKAINPIEKAGAFGVGLVVDLVTFVFRLVFLIPRGIHQCLQLPANKMDHPIRYTRTAGEFNDLPVLVDGGNRPFYFSLTPMHEIEARRYFDDAAKKRSEKCRVVYSETDPDKQADIQTVTMVS